MADFFFFTEAEKLITQINPDNAFGPMADESGFERFNVTSLHSTASSDIKAISCCSGDVIVVADAIDPLRINLLIRPHEQPGIGLPGIKYIIYRGILRNSLISGLEIAARDTNDLTESIWDSQDKRNLSWDKSVGNGQTTTTPPQLSSLEVIVDSGTSTTLISSLFVNPITGEVQHPLIEKGGLHIGNFDTDNFGIEFIVDEIGFEPTLEYLTLQQYIIRVALLPNPYTQSDFFDHWNEKEKMLFFLDPCAVYGSFYQGKLSIKDSEPKTGISVYTDILQSFYNKNYIYLDIRNELNYSYNYFKNYTNPSVGGTSQSLYMNFGNPDLSIDNFGGFDYNTWNLNWPILRIENMSFLSTFEVQISEELELEISFPKCNNPNPTLALKQGKLKQPKIFRRKRSTGDYRHLIFPGNSHKTEIVTLILPNYMPSPDTVNLISSYVRISYIKQSEQCINSGTASTTEFRSWFDLDNVFTPFDMFLPWGSTLPNPVLQIQDSWVYKNEAYLDVMRTSSQFFFANSGIARDSLGNITLFAFATNKLRSNRTVNESPFSLVGRRENVGNVSYIQNIARLFSLSTTQILDPVSGNPIEFFGNVATPVINNFNDYNPDDFAFLNFQQADWATLQTVATTSGFLPGYKIHLGFRYISSTPRTGTTFYSDASTINSIDLITYEIVLRGFRTSIAGTEIESFEVPTTVLHYRIRRNITDDVMKQNQLTNIDSGDNNLRIPSGGGTPHYTVTNLGDNLTVDEPLGNRMNPAEPNLTSSNVSSRAISCNLYLFRSDNVTPEAFCSVMNYIRENIQLVWNSASNYGLGANYEPFMPAEGGTSHAPGPVRRNGIITRHYWIDSSDVHVLEASNRHFDLLEENEVLWLITVPQAASSSRSFISPDTNRTGVFYYTNAMVPSGANPIPPYVDPDNTAAHEFGHVLGLTDRYTSWANYLPANVPNKTTAGGTNTAFGWHNVVAMGGKTSTYLSMEQDDEYPIYYGWLHNLMSTQHEVGTLSEGTPTRAADSIFSETTYYCCMFPYRNIPNPFNPKISIFVTRKQLEYIVTHSREPRNTDYCFFKKTSNDIPIDPSNGDEIFAGIRFNEVSGEDDSISDSTYPARWFLFSLYDHQMDARIRVQPEDDDNEIGAETEHCNPNDYPIAWTRLDGNFSPFVGVTPLTPNEPSYLNPFPTPVRQGGNIDISELETGGNSFNRQTMPSLPNSSTSEVNYGINQYHLIFASIIELTTEMNRLYKQGGYNSLSSTTAATSVQCPILQSLIGQLNITNDMNILQQVLQRVTNFSPQFVGSVTDNFSRMGKGNKQGRTIWNCTIGDQNNQIYQYGDNGARSVNIQRSIHRNFVQFQSIYGDNSIPNPPTSFNDYVNYPRYSQLLDDNFIRALNSRGITSDLFNTFNIESYFFYNRRRIIAIINQGS